MGKRSVVATWSAVHRRNLIRAVRKVRCASRIMSERFQCSCGRQGLGGVTSRVGAEEKGTYNCVVAGDLGSLYVVDEDLVMKVFSAVNCMQIVACITT